MRPKSEVYQMHQRSPMIISILSVSNRAKRSKRHHAEQVSHQSLDGFSNQSPTEKIRKEKKFSTDLRELFFLSAVDEPFVFYGLSSFSSLRGREWFSLMLKQIILDCVGNCDMILGTTLNLKCFHIVEQSIFLPLSLQRIWCTFQLDLLRRKETGSPVIGQHLPKCFTVRWIGIMKGHVRGMVNGQICSNVTKYANKSSNQRTVRAQQLILAGNGKPSALIILQGKYYN